MDANEAVQIVNLPSELAGLVDEETLRQAAEYAAEPVDEAENARAATKIGAAWRGHHVRKAYHHALDEKFALKQAERAAQDAQEHTELLERQRQFEAAEHPVVFEATPDAEPMAIPPVSSLNIVQIVDRPQTEDAAYLSQSTFNPTLRPQTAAIETQTAPLEQPANETQALAKTDAGMGDEKEEVEEEEEEEEENIEESNDAVPLNIPRVNAPLPLNSTKAWINKPYLGGFRHKLNQVEYFHAATQTPRPEEIRARNAPPRFHRDSQTKYLKNRKVQSFKQAATQIETKSLFLTASDDNVLFARNYVSADDHEQWVLRNIIRIQCWVRKVYAIRKVRRMREKRDRAAEQEAYNQAQRKEWADKELRRKAEGRVHPKTRRDFELLYNGLEQWREKETRKINTLELPDTERLAKLANLLKQEAALLQKIDKLKLAANLEMKDKQAIKTLDQMAAPKGWALADGTVQSIETPNIVRARELRDLYKALTLNKATIDERLQILLHVKYTVKEFDCKLSREIVELIDREGDLISRGRDGANLDGLRKRIAHHFLTFVQTPEFNPEALNYSKVAQTKKLWTHTEFNVDYSCPNPECSFSATKQCIFAVLVPNTFPPQISIFPALYAHWANAKHVQ